MYHYGDILKPSKGNASKKKGMIDMINYITRLTNERGTHIQVHYCNGNIFRYSTYHMPNKKIPKTVLAIINNTPYETKDTEFGKVEYFK